MTHNELMALIQKTLDAMVEDGILRVARIDERGRKVYVITEAGKSQRWRTDNALAVRIRRPFGERAKAAMARS